MSVVVALAEQIGMTADGSDAPALQQSDAVGRHSDLLRESDHYRHVISSLEVEEARLREREVNL